MNDKPISVGDLVYVFRHHDCQPLRGYGTIFMVESIEPGRNWSCHCGFKIDDGRPLAFGHIPRGHGFHPLAWCKRIPPLSELEGERTEENIMEPA